jgi:hypothetical protein
MQATIYIHDKDIEKFKILNLRKEVKERIVSAKKVGKSLPFMFEIRDREVLKDIEKVALLKISLQ